MKRKVKNVLKIIGNLETSDKKYEKQEEISNEVEKEIEWKEDSGSFFLEGEEVLLWSFKMPIIPENKKKGKWVQQYYHKVEKIWRKRWEEEVYHKACADLQEKRSGSRIFTPWKVSLMGEGEFVDSAILSVGLKSTQKTGKGLTCMSFCGDLWNLDIGAPLSAQRELALKGVSKRDIIGKLSNIKRNTTEFHLNPDFYKNIPRYFSWERIFFTKEETVAFFPQGTVTAMEDGISKFTICSEK